MKKTLLALALLGALLLTTACGDDADGTNTSANSNGSSGSSQSESSAQSASGNDQTAPENTEADPGETLPESEPGETGGDDEIIFTDEDVDVFVVKGSPVVDGEKDEVWNNAQTVTLDLVKKDAPSEDTVVKASAMWDESAIYFLFEITDSQIFNGGSVGDYNNDGIYLYIAENMDIYAPDADSYGYGAYQFALISPELEMLPRKGDTGADLNAHSAYAPTTDGMIIEFSYTFTDGELANGAFIALDYQYNDCEESGVRLGAMAYYNQTDGDFNTNNLAIAKLCETIPEL